MHKSDKNSRIKRSQIVHNDKWKDKRYDIFIKDKDFFRKERELKIDSPVE